MQGSGLDAPARPAPTPTSGLFGSVAIHWMAVDIQFFYGYPPFGLEFGLEDEMDRDSQILSKMVVEIILKKVLDINNHFWLTYSWHPRSFSSRSPVQSLGSGAGNWWRRRIAEMAARPWILGSWCAVGPETEPATSHSVATVLCGEGGRGSSRVACVIWIAI
jgi:hypothetical protein